MYLFYRSGPCTRISVQSSHKRGGHCHFSENKIFSFRTVKAQDRPTGALVPRVGLPDCCIGGLCHKGSDSKTGPSSRRFPQTGSFKTGWRNKNLDKPKQILWRSPVSQSHVLATIHMISTPGISLKRAVLTRNVRDGSCDAASRLDWTWFIKFNPIQTHENIFFNISQRDIGQQRAGNHIAYRDNSKTLNFMMWQLNLPTNIPIINGTNK